MINFAQNSVKKISDFMITDHGAIRIIFAPEFTSFNAASFIFFRKSQAKAVLNRAKSLHFLIFLLFL